MKKRFEAEFVATATKGTLLSKPHSSFAGIGTDTRKDLTDQLFVALRGPSFDAHDFLRKAVEQGAAGLLVDKPVSDADILAQATVIQVQDTLAALQDLGNRVRKNAKALVLAITGSNGKTSTKEFAAQIIGPFKNVHYNKGSFNNHWGVPLTLLEVNEGHEVVLSEMGMNHAGEITELMRIAEPDVVLCTTVGQAHIENFANMEELAKAKSEIYRDAKPEATGVFNLDNPHTKLMHQAWLEERGPQSQISFSANLDNNEATVCLELNSMEQDSVVISGVIKDPAGGPVANLNAVKVPVFGKHNVSNLMAASCLALAAGLTPRQIVESLPHCHTTWGRNQLVKLKSGASLIFDGYNANPDSMTALLDNMRQVQLKGRCFGVFGEMLEMGGHSAQLHEELGAKVASLDFEWVWFVGSQREAFERGLKRGGFTKSSVFSDAYEESIASKLRSMLEAQDVVLVKGSRGIRLEQVVFALEPIDFAIKA